MSGRRARVKRAEGTLRGWRWWVLARDGSPFAEGWCATESDARLLAFRAGVMAASPASGDQGTRASGERAALQPGAARRHP